jgi:hypothetical protein
MRRAVIDRVECPAQHIVIVPVYPIRDRRQPDDAVR